VVAVPAGALLWLAADAHRLRSADAHADAHADARHARAEALARAAGHADEVLTMSAHMAVATGAPAWFARYDSAGPALEAALAEVASAEAASADGPGGPGAAAARAARAAHARLGRAERGAFALARAGRGDSAQRVLAGAAYRADKAAYAAAQRALVDAGAADRARRSRAERARARRAEWVALLALAGCVATWAAGLRAVARWRRALETRLRAVFDRSAVGISVLDPAGRVVDANAAFAALVGRPREAVLGRVAASFSPAEDGDITRDLVRALRAGERDRVDVEKRFLRPDGSTRWGRVTLTTMPLPEGQGLVGIVQDITDRKGLEARLAHQAMHDPLTDLPNRALLLDRVAHALARAGRRPGNVVMLLVDLDGFRRVNEALGQAAGDHLLVTAASRLRHATRGADTVARVGVDEFAVLLEDVGSAEDVRRVTDRVRRALARPIPVEGTPVVLRASVGVAPAGETAAPEALLRDAAVAVARAKQLGGDRTVHFAGDLERVGAHHLALEADLRAAIEGAAGADPAGPGPCPFHLLYQPIVALDGGAAAGAGRPEGVEALVRWQHPGRGLVSPADFIPLAEETGLVVPLGRWVLREAVRQAARWRADLGAAAAADYVSVNVSAQQLRDDHFVAEVRDALAEEGLPPECLLLEITETALVHDTPATVARLAALKALGVRLAVDDFGTGYSSLGYLQRFPVDVLKIDRVFVDGLQRGGSDAALARTVVALGGSLGLRTVAEGVETAEQAAALRAMGCTYAQGFLFARPLTAAAVEARLRGAAAPAASMPAAA
jgi:diguanylate cyclase (GGDEF)-like protein/PAS domain S-box-containing protein